MTNTKCTILGCRYAEVSLSLERMREDFHTVQNGAIELAQEYNSKIAALEARCIEAEQAEANSHRCHEATIVRCDAAEARGRELEQDVADSTDLMVLRANKARIAELEAALRKYGGHARNCAHIQGHYKGPSRDCDCDWVNAFPAAMGASTKETACEHDFKPHFTNTPIMVGSSCAKCGMAGPDMGPSYPAEDGNERRRK